MPLKRLVEAARRAVTPRATVAPEVEFPLEEEQRLYAAHGRAPVDKHLDVLYGDFRIGDKGFVELFRETMARTGTVVTPFNVFQRFETRRQLCRYLFATMDVPGLRAECGVYRGATALLLCHAMRSCHPGFDGTGMVLIDSFSGTSASVAQDLIPIREKDGDTTLQSFFPAGKTDVSIDLVRTFFAEEFPGVAFHPGWIPQVFASLPESRWACVHLDVTLFEPTLAALEYFYPRLSPGGVILCDGSIFCPGAERAVKQYCDNNALGYAILGHRTYVLMKDSD